MDDILVVDDNPHIRKLVSEILMDEGYSAQVASTSAECFRAFQNATPSVVILDIWLQDPEMDGLQILEELKKSNPGIPIVIMSAHGTIEVAVRAMRKGAFDYIEKPINVDRLLSIVSNVMELVSLRRKVRVLQVDRMNSVSLIGSSSAMSKLRDSIEKVAKSNARVLLRGPVGAGKDVAARYLHSLSDRAEGPFITANFSAMQQDKVEMSLFGLQNRGEQPAPGLLELAHGGCLYLKEIGDLPMDVQSRLAHAVASQSVNRTGSDARVRIDVRTISSTSWNLEELLECGRLSRSLHDRLNVVELSVPPLNARRSDIPELAAFYIYQMHEVQGLPLRLLSSEAEDMLVSTEWPGNTQQLRNVMERTLILNKSQEPIGLDEIAASITGSSDTYSMTLSGKFIALTLREAREEFEREYLITQINRFGGNISRAAQFIGMERAALHRKLKSLGVVTKLVSGSRIAGLEEPLAMVPEN